MTDSDFTFKAVHEVTGISKRKMQSRSRLWPVVEARMLFVLFLASLGKDDQSLAWLLNRSRTPILNTRHRAQNYITISKSFENKYNRISAAYDNAQSV